ncbi:TolC family protein [Paludibaculum fermentans]|uniref:TolC family protein n=1 Tax=Paludibaculum fermentans TaxID=1473598 RepID=UPI003EB89AC0
MRHILTTVVSMALIPIGAAAQLRWYRPRPVPQINFQNSGRIDELTRAGQLYLSLADAVALALENNLDIELQRLLPRIAATDVLRASGGGQLRGLSLLVNQPAPGIGGPNGPLLTNLTAGSTPTPLVNTNFSDLALISRQQNNLSVAGGAPLSSGTSIPQYDPSVSGGFNWMHQSDPQFSTVLTGGSNWLVSKNTNGSIEFTQGFSTGTQIDVNFDNTRFTNNATRYTYDPTFNSNLGITVRQPLLRGFGIDLNRRYIRIAKNSEKVAALVFQQQVIDTIAGISRLYTDLVSLNEDVNVKRESLKLAQRLYDDNRNKVDQGTLAPIEVTRARAQVAASQQALISAEGLVRQQELIVVTALTRRGLASASIRDAHIVPTDSLTVPDQETAVPLENLIADALKTRPDLTQAGIQVENTQISLKGSRNALRPSIDVVGVVRNGGLAGDLNPLSGTVAGSVPTGGYGTTLGQIFRRNNPTYGVGVQMNLPLRNRVAQADAARDELQLRQTQIQREQLEDQARLEVADAQVSLQQARASYEAAVQTRLLQEQSVDVEQQKFDVGLSTNFLVIQYQSFLAQARSTEVAAKGAYAKARIALERATGSILRTNGISIDEAYRGTVSRPHSPAR